jgi:hypothetical protein
VYNKDTFTPVFIAALFIISKLWNQPIDSSIVELLKKMWYIYTMKFSSDIKQKEIMSFAGK